MSDLVYLSCVNENDQEDLIPVPAELVDRSNYLTQVSEDFEGGGTTDDPFVTLQTASNLVTCKAVTDLTRLVEYMFLRKNEWPAYEAQFKQDMVKDPRQLFFLMNAQHLLDYHPLRDGPERDEFGRQLPYKPLDSDNPFLNNPDVSDVMEYIFKLATDITDKLIENGASDDVLMQVLGIPPENKPTEQDIEKFLTQVDTEIDKLTEQDKREAEQQAQREIAALQQQSS